MDVDLWLSMSQDFQFKRLTKTIAYAYQHEWAKTTAEIPRVRVETSLLVAEYGGWDIARRHLIRQADELVEARSKIRTVTQHPLYRLVQPIYKWLIKK
jgi:uncharacterized protein with gpF-like domain